MSGHWRKETVVTVSREIGRAVRANPKDHRLLSLRDQQWWLLAAEFPTAADFVAVGIPVEDALRSVDRRTEWMRRLLAMDVRAPEREKPADPVAEFLARANEAQT